jgi:hypothetical protein
MMFFPAVMINSPNLEVRLKGETPIFVLSSSNLLQKCPTINGPHMETE